MTRRKGITEYPPYITEPYYHGCYREKGHYPFDTSLFLKAKGPGPDWLWHNDGNLPPQNIDQVEGVAIKRTWYKKPNGVTVLSFWDRSVDSRPGSSSSFMLPGVLTFQEALEAAREAFPKIWERYEFVITEYELND